MKDLCRICRARLVGNQCRWIFTSSANGKLQVILSHVLGREVTRDGRGEFLCGKCVFQLEKVMKSDVEIRQLQDEYNTRIQRLQTEKEHLIQCVLHVYNKNNSDRSDGGSVCSKTLLKSPGMTSPVDELWQQGIEKQQYQERGRIHTMNRMRRCVSLDKIAGKGLQSSIKFESGNDGSMRPLSLRGSRHRSQSMYLDLVHRKGSHSRHGFIGRSTSLQSLSRDFAATTSQSLSKLKPKVGKVFGRPNTAGDTLGRAQAQALVRSTSTQPSVISDLIQLLRCICTRQISAPAGSHIPILKRLNVSHFSPSSKHSDYNDNSKTLHELAEEFEDEYAPLRVKSEVNHLKSLNQQLTQELTQIRKANESLTKTLEDIQTQTNALTKNLEEKEDELDAEKKNALKRDKTIQGLTQVLRQKENEIAELSHEIEDRDEALSKAREAAHKAQLQKYQGAEEHQNLLMEKQTELAQLHGEHHAKQLETQKLQRALDRKEQELADLQQAKDQLELELEDLQQQKKKGDKALNDLNNQLKKLSGDIKDKDSALEQQFQELLDQTKQKVLAHEVTIQRLTSTVMDKEKQLQEYINMIRDLEQSKTPEGNDGMLSKLRQRLREKEKALDQALDEKFSAIEDKDNEIHQLKLSLREKERDLERLNNVVSHNEDTINSFDRVIKEKDVELQHLANTLKNLHRSKQDIEDNLSRSLREKDSIISQLQLALEGKTKDLEELAASMLNQSQSHARDLAEQMGQRLKVTEAMLAEAVKARERLVADNESAVEGLLATINSKDQLLRESAEHYNYMLSQHSQEIEDLRKQLSERQQQLNAIEKQSTTRTQEGLLDTAELRVLLEDKERLITKLLQQGKERDQYLSEIRHMGESEHVLELRHTIQIMQEKLDEKEAELSCKDGENKEDSIPLPRNNIIFLKKELDQKTEALNKALKRESELKVSFANVQSLLNEAESRYESQTANIESLTSTLKTKDEIIDTLHQRLGHKTELLPEDSQDLVSTSEPERFLPKLPQREQTIIGGDSQNDAMTSLTSLQQEHEALNRALKAEQQLYSSLVRTVKEQDSAQRLHALQLELTAVQLLRQQLEENIKTNEELRDDLEREIHRAKLREGAVQTHSVAEDIEN